MKRAVNGLLVVLKTTLAKPPPNPLIPDDNPPIPTKNKYKQKNTPKIFKNVNCFFSFCP